MLKTDTSRPVDNKNLSNRLKMAFISNL